MRARAIAPVWVLGGKLGGVTSSDKSCSRFAYLFTDIQGSTERWERAPAAMHAAIADHNAIIEQAVVRYGGYVQDCVGDGVFAVFYDGEPLHSALEIQQQMQSRDWQDVDGLLVRIGVHTSNLSEDPLSDRVAINRAARIAEGAWGGQIAVSAEAAQHLPVPPNAKFIDLGMCMFRGVGEPLQVLGLTHGDLKVRQFPPYRSERGQPSGLPPRRGPIFGRERQLGDLEALLRAGGWVTITGAGGNGKTRLACELAYLKAQERPVFFVSLAEQRTPADALSSIASALGLPLSSARHVEASVVSYLKDKRALLVLDNADHMVANAQMLTRLTASCAGLCLLVTSRGPLGAEGETAYQLRGFKVPESTPECVRGSDAYGFFLNEARRQDPKFSLDEADFGYFRGLCEVVAGSPLALRLAAQWVPFMSMSELHALVRANPDQVAYERTDASSDANPLRRMFESSWQLLDFEEQTALAWLSRFDGDFDWRAALEAAGVAASTLLSFQQKGLIEPRANRRFTLHPLIKTYARERLVGTNDASHAERRRRTYFLAKVTQAYASGDLERQAQALEELDDDFENIKAAWRSACRDGDVEWMSSAIEPLFYYLASRSRFSEALAMFDMAGAAEAFVSYSAALRANCLVQQGEFMRAEKIARSLLRTHNIEPIVRAHALHALGNALQMRGALGDAKARYVEAKEIRGQLGDANGSGYTLLSLAKLEMSENALEAARDWIKEAYLLSRASGNGLCVLMCVFLAGDIALQEQRYEDARANFSEVLRMEDIVRHAQYRANGLLRLGVVNRNLGEISEALEVHAQALRYAKDMGDSRLEARLLVEMAADHAHNSHWSDARNVALGAARLALEMGAAPIVREALEQLVRAESGLGNVAQAGRIAAVLRGEDPVWRETGSTAVTSSDGDFLKNEKTTDAGLRKVSLVARLNELLQELSQDAILKDLRL